MLYYNVQHGVNPFRHQTSLQTDWCLNDILKVDDIRTKGMHYNSPQVVSTVMSLQKRNTYLMECC